MILCSYFSSSVPFGVLFYILFKVTFVFAAFSKML
ncbi:unnamed protein product [Tenebrio molitor]|nr:unnamed protein product [Tenebrio molitor]